MVIAYIVSVLIVSVNVLKTGDKIYPKIKKMKAVLKSAENLFDTFTIFVLQNRYPKIVKLMPDIRTTFGVVHSLYNQMNIITNRTGILKCIVMVAPKFIALSGEI